jgi:hypothetical protein
MAQIIVVGAGTGFRRSTPLPACCSEPPPKYRPMSTENTIYVQMRELRDSLIGWVVMWRPLEVLIYIYGLWTVVRERRLLQRLPAADIHVSTGLGRPAAAAR